MNLFTRLLHCWNTSRRMNPKGIPPQIRGLPSIGQPGSGRGYPGFVATHLHNPEWVVSVVRRSSRALAFALVLFCAKWWLMEAHAQTPPTFPLSLDQNAFFYRTFPVYRTNTDRTRTGLK